MLKTTSDLIDSFHDDDILFAFRRRKWILFGAVCIFVFLPGSVFVFANGFRLLAASVIFLLAMFVVNAYSLIRGKAAQLPMALFVLSLMVAVGLCIVQRGVVGTFWTFPAVLLINFLAVGKFARIYTGVFFVYSSAVMIYTLEPSISLRAATGLGITILITNIFLAMIAKLQQKLTDQSRIDTLTGALNRRETDAILQDAVERKWRSNTPASILMLDVDEFKGVNDTFGHAVGDRVLKELTQVIQRRARYLDRVFRMGGEEFMIFLPDTPASGAAVFAEDFRTLVAETVFVEDRPITVSMGISELRPEETTDQWIKRGDDALYVAKNNGRNQVAGDMVEEHMFDSFIDPFTQPAIAVKQL